MSQDLADFPLNPSIGTFVVKNQCLYGYIKIGGMETWYPFASKTNSYIHSQGLASLQWVVQHNLGTTDVWTQIKDSFGNIVQAGITIIDENTIHVNFTQEAIGTVIVVAPDSIDVPQIKATMIEVAGGAIVIDNTGVLINGSYALTAASMEVVAQTIAEQVVAEQAAPITHVGATGDIHGVATTSVAGFMSATDKTKLDGIASGAEVNQNAFSNVQIAGQGTLIADSKTDTIAISAGTGLSITTDATTDSIVFTNSAPDQIIILTGSGATTISGIYPSFTIGSTDTTYSAGNGLSLTGTTFTLATPDTLSATSTNSVTATSHTHAVTFPVTSVNTKTGAVSLSAADVAAIPAAEKGTINGIATLDNSGKVPISELPDYVSNIVGGSYISITGTKSADWVPTIAIDADVENTENKIVARDANGEIAVTSVDINSIAKIGSATATTNSTTPIVLLTFPAIDYAMAEIKILASEGVNRHGTKILVMHNNLEVISTEYGILQTGVALFGITTNISNGMVQILITPTLNSSIVFSAIYELIHV